ncbi:NADH-quinone oxidoreductase subunit K [Marinobacterium jannaschii]|uniref:NADH-quinone oxidoreductase subunit K n=1 Tax=Marinobacterium jannaschii TaxID=64970 RepID=UPI000683D891|nr:NADH-quinone oxidoreductase subunit K [Marinobacterium jannaschii]
MLLTTMIYGGSGLGLFVIGLYGALLPRSLFARILAVNVSSAGVFLILIALAYRGFGQLPDPLPHALVLTGLVVAISATALALVLDRRLQEMDDD